MHVLDTFGDLESFNDVIMRQRAAFVPAPELFYLFDAESLGYIDSESEWYYGWLALAVRILTPRHVLELGSFRGGSAVCLFQELDAFSKLTSVDLIKDLRFCPPRMLHDPRVSFVLGNDLDLSIYEERVPLDIDFLFIDTVHSFHQISAEWAIYQHLLMDRALVVLDDIRLHDMGKFWEELRYQKLEATEHCHSSGFGAFIFEREVETDEECRLSKAWQASREAMSRDAHLQRFWRMPGG